VGYIISGFIDNPFLPLLVVFAIFICVLILLNRLFGVHRYSLEQINAETVAAKGED
jgi:hypothetical protein